MHKPIVLALALMTLTACAAPALPIATDTPQPGIPNPASVYCREAGNTLENRTAADGSQYGVCVLPDGRICDEWAYFQATCGPAPTATAKPTAQPAADDPVPDDPAGGLPAGATEAIDDWWGVIRKTDRGSQYDDYFERQDLGQPIMVGIDSRDPAVADQIQTLRDSGKVVHLRGMLCSNVPDYNGSQILVISLVVDE